MIWLNDAPPMKGILISKWQYDTAPVATARKCRHILGMGLPGLEHVVLTPQVRVLGCIGDRRPLWTSYSLTI